MKFSSKIQRCELSPMRKFPLGVTVSYDGEVIAAVASQSEADQVRSNLETVTTRTLGESFTIDDSLIQYSSGLLTFSLNLPDISLSFRATTKKELPLHPIPHAYNSVY